METITLDKNEVQIVKEAPSYLGGTFKFRAGTENVSIDNDQFEKYIAGLTRRYLDLSPKPRNRKHLKLALTCIVVTLAVTLGSSFYSAIASAPAAPASHLQAQQTIIVHSNTVSQP